jgi:uncharacterized protein YjdB
MQHKTTLIAVSLVSATFMGACGTSASSPTGPSTSTSTSATVTASSLTVTGLTTLSRRGESFVLSALVIYSDGTIQDRTGTSRWSSANEAVATVNDAGVVTAMADGHTTVTATFGNISGAKTVVVDLPLP